MKKVFTIFLSVTVLLCSLSNGVVFAFFKIQQSDIVERLCINRSQPEKKCEGKCFLKNRFEEKNNDQNPIAPWSSVDEIFKINFILSQLIESPISNDTYLNRQVFPISSFSFQSFTYSLLRPPICELIVV